MIAESLQILEVGKLIKSTKKEYKWNLVINTTRCQISFVNSKFTGKFKFFVNNTFYKGGNNTYENNFKISFTVEKLPMKIMKHLSDFELYVNAIPFSKLPLGKKYLFEAD